MKKLIKLKRFCYRNILISRLKKKKTKDPELKLIIKNFFRRIVLPQIILTFLYKNILTCTNVTAFLCGP